LFDRYDWVCRPLIHGVVLGLTEADCLDQHGEPR
jgi:hypothetical protein